VPAQNLFTGAEEEGGFKPPSSRRADPRQLDGDRAHGQPRSAPARWSLFLKQGKPDSAKGVKEMLFIDVLTFEPDKRDEIVKRRLEKGMMIPEGVKMLGEFLALRGHLIFLIFETDDPGLIYELHHAWSDLVRFDLLPVMSVGDRFEEMVK
jgi:hypothetical protein